MSEHTYRSPRLDRRELRQTTPWLIRLPLLVITGAILFAFVMIFSVSMHQVRYDGLIYPGVSAYGIPLGGLTRVQAAEALSQRYTYGSQAIFTFRDMASGKTWQFKAANLGVQYNPQETVERAYRIGRDSSFFRALTGQWNAWVKGEVIQPTIIYDQSTATTFLEGLAAGLNKPVQDATIVIQGRQVITTPSQVGRALDIPATLNKLRKSILNMDTGGEIELVIAETQPEVIESETAALKVRAALNSPIQLYVDAAKEGVGPWQITPDFIAGIISITKVPESPGSATFRYDVTADSKPVRTLLVNLGTQLRIEPVSARFTFNPNTRQLDILKESVGGRSLNVDATLKRFDEVIFKTDNRRVALLFREELPAVNSRSTAEELGIKQEVVRATTFFFGSSPERRTNISVAAANFHGVVISPGEVFSFNRYLGDVSPETGYETGLVIIGNQTIKGVGGGVCQVSSTVFQAAFFAGFPINERYPHGYRVGYYESGTAVVDNVTYKSGVGMDATVYAPVVDFKFTNDTKQYLLMEAYFDNNASALTFKFFSTPTGRVVTKEGPFLSSPVPHGPAIYEESAELRAGQTRQVDYAVDGVDTKVYRTIKINNQTVGVREEFYSHYLPWQARFQVARGYAPKNKN
jgi:vancomycin resistance protein YoaR